MATVYEGTWEEIKAHEAELAGRKVRLIVEETPDEAAIRERVARIDRGLAMAREFGKDLSPVPERRITLAFLYPDEDEPR